jgi:hypothetical protein
MAALIFTDNADFDTKNPRPIRAISGSLWFHPP